MKSVGVLALQGAFREHILMFRRCGAEAAEVRLPGELEEVSGLVIPGGESTTMTKLMVEYGFPDKIRAFSNAGNPIFGTCAGAIVLSGRLNGKKQDILNLIDMDMERNAYGRQVESRETEIVVDALGSPAFPAIFIRAPIIRAVGSEVETMAAYGNTVVLARQGKVLVATFHPELSGDPRIHRYFLRMIAGAV